MNNFEEIVMQIAKSRGIDFTSLPKEKQNTVIGELFAHLEGIFRDMADYPDDRFGRRKGIYKARVGEDAPQIPDNADSSGCPIDTLQCPVIDTTNCPQRDWNCPENDGKSCDNKCINNNTDDCRDDSNCVDNECDNSGGAEECVDNTNCQDTGCQNSAGGTSGAVGCVDNQNCTDTSGCTNSPPPDAECQDNNNCIDIECRNQARAGLCTDTTTCKDDMCCNRRCKDSGTSAGACLDDMCGNGRSCTDNSTGSGEANYCKDGGCVNSPDPVTPNCTDTNCVDTPCLNFSGCEDKFAAGFCTDRTCKSAPQGTDYTYGCSDSSTACNPWYIDGIFCETAINDSVLQESQAVKDVSDSIDERQGCLDGHTTRCVDVACIFIPGCTNWNAYCSTQTTDQPCTHGIGTNPAYICLDTSSYCTDDSNCENGMHCHDKGGCEDKDCENKTSTSFCSDWDGCIDKENCSNTNFCQDQTDCQDGTASGEKCINSRCINVAQNCTDLDCENAKCMDYKERYTDNVEACHDYICDP